MRYRYFSNSTVGSPEAAISAVAQQLTIVPLHRLDPSLVLQITRQAVDSINALSRTLDDIRLVNKVNLSYFLD
jgi:hypothetical protein